MAASDALIGQSVSHHRILEKLGLGMGVVYSCNEARKTAIRSGCRSIRSLHLQSQLDYIQARDEMIEAMGRTPE